MSGRGTMTHRRAWLRSRTVERLMPWAVIVVFFALWELCVHVFAIPRFLLPPPSSVFATLWEFRWPIAVNSWQTLMTTVIGFAFAVVPVLVIWFGIGTVPAIISAFLISFFPILVNVATGIATVEPELRDVLRALGAKNRDIILKVGLPRSMPYFFASLKIAITVAFVGSIIAETVAANAGIGHMMIAASSRFDVPLVFAGLLVTAFMGIAMYVVASLIEERMTGWATRSMDPNLSAPPV